MEIKNICKLFKIWNKTGENFSKEKFRYYPRH